MNSNKYPLSIGMDVSKAKLDVALLFNDDSYLVKQFDNTDLSIQKLLAWFKEQQASRCPLCLEATGGYERKFCEAGYQANYSLRLVSPKRIYNYRQSVELRNKTDIDDARLIALFAKHVPTSEWKPASKAVQKLREQLKLYSLMTANQVRLKVSSRSLRDAQVARQAAKYLRTSQRQIEKLVEQMGQVIEKDRKLSHMNELLLTIPGIGLKTAMTLCAFVDIDRFARSEQLCAYLGVVPMRSQSGSRESRTRVAKQSHRVLRTALFMASLSAKKHNPMVCRHANRLETDRPDLAKKQIMIACAHKLSRIIFGVLKKDTPFCARQ